MRQVTNLILVDSHSFLYFSRFCLVLALYALLGDLFFVDFPLMVHFCPADYVLWDWQPRILLGMVEAQSMMNTKNQRFS